MRLFIGNATKQVHRFCYRVPEVRGFRYRDIQVGQQICLDDKELNKPVVNSIIEHQARYGFVSVSELDRVKDRYIGLIYSIDKAIPPIKMARMVDHNDGVMVEKGKVNRIRAGIAASNEAAKFVAAQSAQPIRSQTLKLRSKKIAEIAETTPLTFATATRSPAIHRKPACPSRRVGVAGEWRNCQRSRISSSSSAT